MELGWIDFSKTERDKVFSVLKWLNEGVLDELGIAPIRDSFSELFFPGTSTNQTRAKYFCIVPYAFRDLESNPKIIDYEDLLKELKKIEIDCATQMSTRDSNQNGIIGSNAIQNDSWVSLSPSSIYLAGLRKYKIFKSDASLRLYLENISKEKSIMGLSKFKDRNDEENEGIQDDKYANGGISLGILNIETYNPDWKKELSINLTKKEGIFLKEQITSCFPDSLLSFILDNDLRDIVQYESFHRLEPIKYKLPPDLQYEYDLAIKFSNFNYALVVIYNLIASQKNNKEANSKFGKIDFVECANIDIDEIMNKRGVHNPPLRRFLIDSKEAMLDKNWDRLKDLIIEREVKLKGPNKSKLINPNESEFDKWHSGRYLDYRFSRAKVIIDDIFKSQDLVE